MQSGYIQFNEIDFPQDILFLKENLSHFSSNIKVKNENIFLKTNKKTKATIFKAPEKIIFQLSNVLNEQVVNLDKTHKGFYFVNSDYLMKFIETSSMNLNFFGAKKTELQEIGVLLYLDNNLKDLTNYKPSKKMNLSDIKKINETISFLNNSPDWNISCFETAKKIAKEIPDWQSYEFHHGSELFNCIKRKGKSLSGLGSDKWNPADIFLIKNTNEVKTKLNSFNNILDYNAYISTFDNVIGISLKKSDKEALHGAVALETIIKKMNLGEKLNVINDLEIIKENLKIQLNQIKNSPLAKYVFLSKTHCDNLNDNIENINPESKNFFKSLPLGVEFLTRICSNIELAKKTIKTANLSASSKDIFSCPHLKAEPEKIFLVNNKNDFKFRLNRIIVPLNGETNVIFAIEINDEPIKLQLRSKGTKPQFMIIKLNATKGKMKNISEFY